MANWHFRRKQPGEKERNPVTGEYFDEEAIDRPAQALVREVIQNSLDARTDGQAVSVRFYVSGRREALAQDRASRWLRDVWPHFAAEDSGLRNVPQRPEICPFLVVEDFGTIGLEGDPNAVDLSASEVKNHFYAFFRAEGVSLNTGGRGKWGVGKTVFARSSKINTLFGFTVRRSDNQCLLMGQTVLRFHRISPTKYAPDGMFGEPGSNDFVLPIDDTTTIDEFCQDFRLERLDESGLSVVVPYPHQEITGQAIIQAVGREYFFPILTGKLRVVVEGPEFGNDSLTLDSSSLLTAIDSEDGDIQGDLRSMILFSIHAHTLRSDQLTHLTAAPAGEPPDWSDALFPQEAIQILASCFARGEFMAFRIPLTVRKACHKAEESHFDVFLRQDLSGRGYPPTFIRNGIIIPQRQRGLRGHRLFALVIIDDKALATMLGDAETPAHTQWSHQTQNFRDKYEHGRQTLDFVRQAPRQIAEVLSGARPQRDPLALADFFPRPPEEKGLEASQGSDSQPPGDRTEPPETPPPSPAKGFEIERMRGGFCIRRADRTVSRPMRLEIDVAYDRSRGNPLSKYQSADFRLESMSKRLPGAREVACHDNSMIVDLLNDDFRIEVTGFDENRDVYVRARAMDRRND